MAKKKRASMREGPLADLFRSTEESVGEEDVRVTATRETTTAQVEVAVAEREPEAAAPEAEVIEPEPAVEPEPETIVEVEAPPVEERRIVTAKEGPLSDATLAPHTDPMVEEVDQREERSKPRSLKVEEETAPVQEPQHEGLERLMGGGPAPSGPAFGRDEPNTIRQATVPRSHNAVLRVVGVGGAGVNAVNRMVEAQVPGVEFVAINTDLQSLQNSSADSTLHIGAELTRGLGSGSDPRVGYRAAYDEQDKIK